jgi:hypothetical protein
MIDALPLFHLKPVQLLIVPFSINFLKVKLLFNPTDGLT